MPNDHKRHTRKFKRLRKQLNRLGYPITLSEVESRGITPKAQSLLIPITVEPFTPPNYDNHPIYAEQTPGFFNYPWQRKPIDDELEREREFQKEMLNDWNKDAKQ